MNNNTDNFLKAIEIIKDSLPIKGVNYGYYESETDIFYPKETFNFSKSYMGICPALIDENGLLWINVKRK